MLLGTRNDSAMFMTRPSCVRCERTMIVSLPRYRGIKAQRWRLECCRLAERCVRYCIRHLHAKLWKVRAGRARFAGDLQEGSI